MVIQGRPVPRLGLSIYYYYYTEFKITLSGISERPQLEIYENISDSRERRTALAADIFKQPGKNRLLCRYLIRSTI
jgi:hypothetical protein